LPMRLNDLILNDDEEEKYSDLWPQEFMSPAKYLISKLNTINKMKY